MTTMATRRGTVSAFYGYKGGSGRSFTLAHVGSILAHGYGRSVLVVDSDLEAPGVGDFFTRMPGTAAPNFARRWRNAPGLLDAIERYGNAPDYEALRKRMRSDGFFTSDWIQPVLEDGTGRLDLLGPGRIRGANYAGNIILQDWNNFYAYGGRQFFHNFARLLREEGRYDHILFDMRAGFAASTAPASMAIADDLVVFANPSHQSIVGLDDLIVWLDGERERLRKVFGERVLRRAAVLTRVEGNVAGGVAWNVFNAFFKDEAYSKFKVLHVADLQHEQIVELNPANRPLVDELVRLAAWIAEDESVPRDAVERAFLDPHAQQSSEPPKPSDQRERESLAIVNSLIDDAKKFVAPGSSQKLPTATSGKAPSDSLPDSAAPAGLSASALRARYDELFLLEAALCDRLLKGQPPETAIEEVLWREEARAQPSGEAAAESPSAGVPDGDVALVSPAAADAAAAPEPPTFDHSEWFPAHFESPADVDRVIAGAGLHEKLAEIVTWLDANPNAPGDKRASAAQDVLRRAAFLEEAALVERTLEELLARADDFADLENAEQRWDVGYSLVFAADAMRQLGGTYFTAGERMLRRGWQAGGLFSPGEPPYQYEAAGILTYAFYLSLSGRAPAAIRTVDNVYLSVKDHIGTSDVFATIVSNHGWWRAAFRLHSDEDGVTDEIVRIDSPAERETIGDPNNVFFDGWLMIARRWRGEIAAAREAAQRASRGQPFYQWLGEPPRLIKLTMLLGKAQAEVLAGDESALRATLNEAQGWAERESSLIEGILAAHRVHIAAMRGLSDDRSAHTAVEDGVAVLRAERLGGEPLTTVDVRHRIPAFVRACATAVRIRHAAADRLLDDCDVLLAQDGPLLANAWGDESRYLLEAAHERHGHDGSAARASAYLDAAARRIGGSDDDVRERARDSLVRLAGIWLDGH